MVAAYVAVGSLSVCLASDDPPLLCLLFKAPRMKPEWRAPTRAAEVVVVVAASGHDQAETRRRGVLCPKHSE